MQQLVGGIIQAVYPFSDYVALVCNDEGKLLGLPLNRGLFHPESGELYDIVAGSFFLCSAPPDQDHFTSLTDSQMEKYMQYFRSPETFLQINGQIFVISETMKN